VHRSNSHVWKSRYVRGKSHNQSQSALEFTPRDDLQLHKTRSAFE